MSETSHESFFEPLLYEAKRSGYFVYTHYNRILVIIYNFALKLLARTYGKEKLQKIQSVIKFPGESNSFEKMDGEVERITYVATEEKYSEEDVAELWDNNKRVPPNFQKRDMRCPPTTSLFGRHPHVLFLTEIPYGSLTSSINDIKFYQHYSSDVKDRYYAFESFVPVRTANPYLEYILARLLWGVIVNTNINNLSLDWYDTSYRMHLVPRNLCRSTETWILAGHTYGHLLPESDFYWTFSLSEPMRTTNGYFGKIAWGYEGRRSYKTKNYERILCGIQFGDYFSHHLPSVGTALNYMDNQLASGIFLLKQIRHMCDKFLETMITRPSEEDFDDPLMLVRFGVRDTSPMNKCYQYAMQKTIEVLKGLNQDIHRKARNMLQLMHEAATD